MAEVNLKFGQIPFWAICRFGERSKIEIIVFSFICAKRFRNTQEADCPRSEIIEYTKLDKSQISNAIKKLTAVNWIQAKSKTKWFVPETEPQKVDESSTNQPENKVDDSTTKVDDFSTPVEDLSTKVDDSSTDNIRNISSDVSDPSQTNKQQKNIPCEVVNLVDEDFADELTETLAWIRQQKNVYFLPDAEWIGLFGILEKEKITLQGFKEFYQWVGNLDWVETVSPNLMKKQIEAWKNREKIEAKKNGQIQPYSNGNKSTDAGTRNAERVNNTRTVISELRRQGAEEQALSGGRNGTS